MKKFRHFLKEENIKKNASRGVPFEWGIVYWCLKSSGWNDDDLKKRNPNLVDPGGTVSSEAKKAIKNVPEPLRPTVYHSDELKISGNPEPKTDILFGKNHEYRVSVKMSGAIQLSSGEGKSTATMLNFVLNEFEKREGIKDEEIAKIISTIEQMPTKMVSPQNINRLEKEKPELLSTMKLSDGSLNPKFNWKDWEAKNKSTIKDFLTNYISINPLFTQILIDEALSGRMVFQNGMASANYIITPNKFVEISPSYTNEVAKKTKIDIRAKSRKGITAATIRFDTTSENKNFSDFNSLQEREDS